jgi:hypothetical protein
MAGTKIDPYNNEEEYLSWKEKHKDRIPEISEHNSDLILSFLNDMEIGINVGKGSKKGSRSFIRLRTLRDKLLFIFKKIDEFYSMNKITEVSEEQLHSFFSGMETGKIKKSNGEKYKAVADYVKIFKAFWHWHQKVNRKKGIEISDITQDLNTKQEKPDWVYLTEEQVKKLVNSAKPEYKVLMIFLFDTGIRSPTELINIKVSDFFNDFKELNIRDEISKTFGRRIKLMICSELVREYIKDRNLKAEDYVFDISPPVANRYLKRLSAKLFGDKQSPAGQKYSELTMYDFRHISCCYWLPRYKSESALKYRFGWKKSDKIHYYSELLGMKDTISEEDILIDVTKTDIEKRLEKSEKDKEILQEKMQVMEEQMKKILEVTKKLHEKIILEQI